MPQFDVVMYSNEIIWVFFFFLSVYSLNYLFFIPRMSEVLKTRSKKTKKDLELFKKIFSKVENNSFLRQEFFSNYLIKRLNHFLIVCSYLNILMRTNLFGLNITIKYYLNIFYSYFDFYELDQF